MKKDKLTSINLTPITESLKKEYIRSIDILENHVILNPETLAPYF